ncbi:MAG: hypothetical protein MUF86_08455 [Akkermansiaceae bacterium]|jgi:hypothetical protein|nr:hypothetical protein [Akkermansiaceae bacterium]
MVVALVLPLHVDEVFVLRFKLARRLLGHMIEKWRHPQQRMTICLRRENAMVPPLSKPGDISVTMAVLPPQSALTA